MTADVALRQVFEAVDQLLRLHGAALTERSRVTFDRRPGVFVLSEADMDAGERPVLMLAADVRDPLSFGQRIRDEASA